MTRSNTAQHSLKPVFPPPDWPGCPGTYRYREAVKTANLQAVPPCQRQPHQQPKLLQRRSQADAHIIQDLYQAIISIAYVLPQNNTRIEDLDLLQTVHLLDHISTEHAIPFSIIAEPEPGLITSNTSMLSRHPKWIGTDPLLPELKGSHALVYTYDGKTPHAFIAVPPDRITQHIDNLPTAPTSHNFKSTRQSRTIDRVLLYHGATTHYLHIDPELYAAEALEKAFNFQDLAPHNHEGPCTPPFHTGNPWEWRN